VGRVIDGLLGDEFESCVCYFVFLLHVTLKFIPDMSFLLNFSFNLTGCFNSLFCGLVRVIRVRVQH